MDYWLKICSIVILLGIGGALSAGEPEYKEIEVIAIRALAEIQPTSIAEGVEYCGWIIEENQTIKSTKPFRGHVDYCDSEYPNGNVILLASFHTHGGHNPDYNSEVPSDTDMEADFQDDTYGFVGTPGGRVWLIDPFQQEAFMVCDESCIPQDQNYDARDYPPIPESFSEDELLEFLEY